MLRAVPTRFQHGGDILANGKEGAPCQTQLQADVASDTVWRRLRGSGVDAHGVMDGGLYHRMAVGAP